MGDFDYLLVDILSGAGAIAQLAMLSIPISGCSSLAYDGGSDVLEMAYATAETFMD